MPKKLPNDIQETGHISGLFDTNYQMSAGCLKKKGDVKMFNQMAITSPKSIGKGTVRGFRKVNINTA